jgi:hypothetical protein
LTCKDARARISQDIERTFGANEYIYTLFHNRCVKIPPETERPLGLHQKPYSLYENLANAINIFKSIFIGFANEVNFKFKHDSAMKKKMKIVWLI